MERNLAIVLKGRGTQRSEGSVLIHSAKPRERFWRAAGVAGPPAALALLLAWHGRETIFLSTVCICVAVLSGAYQARTEQAGVLGSGPCPRCSKPIELNARGVVWPLHVKCAACQRMATIQPAPRGVLIMPRNHASAVDAVVASACDKAIA